MKTTSKKTGNKFGLVVLALPVLSFAEKRQKNRMFTKSRSKKLKNILSVRCFQHHIETNFLDDGQHLNMNQRKK